MGLKVIVSIDIPSHEELLGQNCMLEMSDSGNYVPEFEILIQMTFHYLIIKS